MSSIYSYFDTEEITGIWHFLIGIFEFKVVIMEIKNSGRWPHLEGKGEEEEFKVVSVIILWHNFNKMLRIFGCKRSLSYWDSKRCV